MTKFGNDQTSACILPDTTLVGTLSGNMMGMVPTVHPTMATGIPSRDKFVANASPESFAKWDRYQGPLEVTGYQVQPETRRDTWVQGTVGLQLPASLLLDASQVVYTSRLTSRGPCGRNDRGLSRQFVLHCARQWMPCTLLPSRGLPVPSLLDWPRCFHVVHTIELVQQQTLGIIRCKIQLRVSFFSFYN